MQHYDLELDRAIEEIKKSNASLVCLQLPDGLKPQAALIQKELEARTNAIIVIWAGSCFGGCDIPIEIQRCGFDLLLHWGHAIFVK